MRDRRSALLRGVLPPKNEEAGTGWQSSPAERGESKEQRDFASPCSKAQAGKQVAVFLYCLGARSLAETSQGLAAHPKWRAA